MDLLKHVDPTTAVVAAVAGVLLIRLLFKGSSNSCDAQKPAKRASAATVSQLHPEEFRQFPLIEKIPLTVGVENPVTLFRFGLPDKTRPLGLPVGQHISLRAVIAEKEVVRSYTPTSSDDDLGHFDLVVKVYQNGAMSKHLDGMQIGDKIDVRGPKGRFVYAPNEYTHLAMICGGTGITPMLQIVKEILKHKDSDKTKVSLIFGNITYDDIILRDELEELAKRHGDQFKLFHVLNKPPPSWTGGVGFITKEMIALHAEKPSARSKVLLCGPPPMIKAMKTHLLELSFDEEKHIFAF